jgi:hypothetical protein
MLNSALPSSGSNEPNHEEVDAIVRAGPRGALVVAGIATALVVVMWFAFYLFVFIPRGITL